MDQTQACRKAGATEQERLAAFMADAAAAAASDGAPVSQLITAAS